MYFSDTGSDLNRTETKYFVKLIIQKYNKNMYKRISTNPRQHECIYISQINLIQEQLNDLLFMSVSNVPLKITQGLDNVSLNLKSGL